MDMMEMIKAAKEKTVMHMVEVIDETFHDKDSDELDCDDVKKVKDAWKAIWTAMTVCKDMH